MSWRAADQLQTTMKIHSGWFTIKFEHWTKQGIDELGYFSGNMCSIKVPSTIHRYLEPTLKSINPAFKHGQMVLANCPVWKANIRRLDGSKLHQMKYRPVAGCVEPLYEGHRMQPRAFVRRTSDTAGRTDRWPDRCWRAHPELLGITGTGDTWSCLQLYYFIQFKCYTSQPISNFLDFSWFWFSQIKTLVFFVLSREPKMLPKFTCD
jgi:hypothetical protein